MLTRRRFLGIAAGGIVGAAGARLPLAHGAGSHGAFAHGVASGDPLADRVVLWTRVTPADGSGSAVRWEVARDEAFRSIVARGTTTTDASRDHTVHVDASGLESATDYWYRFHAHDTVSPVGRTRTLPAAGAPLDRLRLGIVTCAEYEFGFFGVYRHLAARDDVDAVLHLGDYIYEFGLDYGTPPRATPTPGGDIGRAHQPPHECLTLDDYRTRYAQHRGDPDLQALHAAHPMIAMYDDHEVANDTWREGAEQHSPEEGDFAARAAAARRAWREWMPVRIVDPADVELAHRRFRIGDLADLWMIDVRRYRDAPPQNAFIGYGSVDPAIDDPSRTMLGRAQRDWLVDGLRTSAAAWKVVGNPVPFFPMVVGPALASAVQSTFAPLAGTTPPAPPPLTVDDWNGYRAERQALVEVIASAPVRDVLFLTGDYHESLVADIPARPGDYVLDGNSVAVELVAPAVTTPGLGETLEEGGLPNAAAIEALYAANLAADNPWVRYHEGRANGFGVVELTPARAQYDFWFLDDRLDPASGARFASSWEVLRGQPRARPAAGPLAPRVRGTTGAPPAPIPPAATLPATGGAARLLAVLAAGLAAAAARAVRNALSDDEGAP